MTKVHLGVILAISVLLSACGGGGGGGNGGGTGDAAEADVSGNITVQAVWTGQEGESFRRVLAGFNERYPNVDVDYKSAQDLATVLATAVQGGNPPDVAALPNPGLLRDFAERGELSPVEFARDTVAENYAEEWIRLASVDGTLYGVFFKGANKSAGWYNIDVFEAAGVEPPATWDELLAAAETIGRYGVPAYSIGGSEGWTLTDLFENVYLRTAGPELYDQLAAHEIPWTHPSVKEALQHLASIFGDRNNIAGGTASALQTDFVGSVTQVFTEPPEASMVFEGDFVAGVIKNETNAEPEKGYDAFAFPSIGGGDENYVVGGGDVMVMFDDSPAARALIEYLASVEAAEIWAERGGFSSPNRNVTDEVYPDPITRRLATALAEADTFRFDLSDLAPARFGSDALFKGLQDFLANPGRVDAIARQLEEAADRAYSR